MTLTEAQARALTLVKTGSYSYDRRSGSVRHRAHRPGTPIVNARTWAALAARGLVEYDDLTYGLAKITDAGRQALSAHGYRVAKSFYADGPSMVEWTVTKDGTEIHESFPTRKQALAWIGEQA